MSVPQFVTRLLAVATLSVGVLMVGAVHTDAATVAPSARFMVQTPAQVTTAKDAAAAWSKGTGVAVSLGPCSGPRCVVVEVVTTTLCDATASGTVLGCRQRQADGSDLLQLRAGLLFDGYHYALQRAVLEHELGHAMGLPHSSSTRSLMYPVIDQYNPPRGPSSTDLRNLSALYP